MAKLIYALNQSLDGYIDHTRFIPSLPLFHHFLDDIRTLAGLLYGRKMYEVMRYWDEDRPEGQPHEHAYAAAWRSKPKWIIGRPLPSVGPNATLIAENVETAVRTLKTDLPGDIEVGGPTLAQTLTEAGLIDEYRLYLHPVVLGTGKPFFTAPRPRLRLVATDPIDEDVIRLTYVPMPRFFVGTSKTNKTLSGDVSQIQLCCDVVSATVASHDQLGAEREG